MATSNDIQIKAISERTILDLPNEVLQKYVIKHLSGDDLKSFASTGIQRFNALAKDELLKRSKSNSS